jgi:hypothetical protein
LPDFYWIGAAFMETRFSSPVGLTLLLLAGVWNAPCSQESATPPLAPPAPQGVFGSVVPLPDSQRVAGGEFKVLDKSGIGPFVPPVFDFTESWTLWRLKDGSFEARGERNYRSPANEPHKDPFTMHLSPDFRVLSFRFMGQLQWHPSSGPITCDFLPGKLSCTSSAQDKNDRINLDLPMTDAYGFLWPITTFSLGGITRTAPHNRKTSTPVELVKVDEGSNPIAITVLTGQLKYLGQEKISIANRSWQAEKFRLHVPMHPPFVLWTSPQGLLLAFGTENKHKTIPDDGLLLTGFEQWQEF